jgi:hypothetical protein
MPIILDGKHSIIQAGLLTFGLPINCAFPIKYQWQNAINTSDYSGGSVFDFHEVPFSVLSYFAAIFRTPE